MDTTEEDLHPTLRLLEEDLHSSAAALMDSIEAQLEEADKQLIEDMRLHWERLKKWSDYWRSIVF